DAILMFRSVGAGSWLRLDPRHLGILSAVPLPPVLDVTLTSKPVGDGKKVPLAGIPYHALNNYLFKLTRAGYRVSIREETIKKPVVLPIRR
ncbi:MAG: hypothetical protein KC964_30130, partial [Candidatus Omnitrophica bacterium]|nr:hypothetical protein [Candidatus Omnitrophota bacterium]